MKNFIFALLLMLPVAGMAQRHGGGIGIGPIGPIGGSAVVRLERQSQRLLDVVRRRAFRRPVRRAARQLKRAAADLALCSQRIVRPHRPHRPFPRLNVVPARCRVYKRAARRALRDVELYVGRAYEFPRLQNLLSRIRTTLQSIRVRGGRPGPGPGPVPGFRHQCTAVSTAGRIARPFLGQVSFDRYSAEQSALRSCQLATGHHRSRFCVVKSCRRL